MLDYFRLSSIIHAVLAAAVLAAAAAAADLSNVLDVRFLTQSQRRGRIVHYLAACSI
jgi:hypothetical protein